MKQFHYKVYDEEGGIHEGSLAAKTKQEAAAALFGEGLSVIRLSEKKEPRHFFRGRPFGSRRSLSLLASSWAALLSAGLTVTEALSLLASKERPQERKILLNARERIASGHSLSESFAAGGWCPSFFISLLEVGEMTGTLPSALTHIALYYEKEDLFRRRLSRALAYPLFVLAFALVLLLVILLFILPSFAMLFETLGITLPLAARAGLALGLFLRHWGLLLGLGLLLVLIAGALHFRTRAGRRRKEAWLYRSAFYRRLLLIRFTLSLASFLESGKPLSEALVASTKVLGNHMAEEKVHGMERKLRQGENFASAWEASGFCFPLLFELCQVGLSSGELPRFLNQAARLMTTETEEKLRRFRQIAEPVMLLFVGGLTALVLFSVMLPVFQMAGSHLAK